MPTVEATVEIAAPKGELFDLSQDYVLRRDWDPFVREMSFTSDGVTSAARGVTVRVRAYNGMTMEVLFTTFNRPDVVAMKMTEGPRMFSRFAGSWRFETLDGPGPRTRIVFRYGFETRWPKLRWLLNPVVAAILRRDVRRRLAGMQRAVEGTDLLRRLGAATCS